MTTGPSVNVAVEREGFGLEMGLYQQRNTGFREARPECRTRPSRSISTMSYGMHGSNEEVLVSEGLKQKRRAQYFQI